MESVMNPMNEQNEERRLEHEAKTCFLGKFYALCDESTAVNGVRVEVSYQQFEDEPCNAGYYIILTPAIPEHPADIASDYVRTVFKWDDYAYFSIDDVYAA